MDKHSPSVLREISYTVGADENGLRADQILAAAFPEYSRARWQAALKAHSILVNQRPAKPKQALFAGDVISGGIEEEQQTQDLPQDLPLEVVFADEDIIVINKVAGMVVHPAVGNADGTLLNAVLHHFPATVQLPRAGIVHRLDKDTSGLMVVAHSLRAHTHLVRQLQEREMGREYLALVHRYVTAGATIDQPIGRHASDRLKMAVRSDGREAITHYRIEERLGDFTLLRVKLETGRTHQIRVHLSENRFPLVGDTLYGGRLIPSKQTAEAAREAVMRFPRQALHAQKLALLHPATEEWLEFECELPSDMQDLLAVLRAQQGAE